jgi:hypothetical protein
VNPVQEKALAAAVRSTLAAVLALCEKDQGEALRHARAAHRDLQRFEGTPAGASPVIEAEPDCEP